MPNQISHSGQTFKSLGIGPNGYQVWPIEEYLVRTKHSQPIADRIRRLNPNGKEEAARPRGWHPNEPSARKMKRNNWRP